jgi:hypothetical protein
MTLHHTTYLHLLPGLLQLCLADSYERRRMEGQREGGRERGGGGRERGREGEGKRGRGERH